MDENPQSEQLEEGEIVDDDDFEDISDNSIIDSTVGKFVSSNENLRALSLSSGSETDIYKSVNHRKKLPYRKSKIKHPRKRRRRRRSSDSSDSDISQSGQDLKGKLKEAVHISGIGEHKNPLETRLKAMGGLGSNAESINITPPPPPQIDDSDKIDDNELENLRIEALKTAVINKFRRRKKKKSGLEGQSEETRPLQTIENKENDTPKQPPCAPSNNTLDKVETKTPIIDVDEDEDVLRASLLAGLARKITKVQTSDNLIVKVKPEAPKLPVQVAPALPKRPVHSFNANNIINKTKVIANVIHNRPKPQVKPLIINVNDDSDTEDESKQKSAHAPPKIADLKVISSSVDKFLKEQRAKFETETKKRFQIVNKNKAILEKSAVKLLPKSQQIEYQQLLKKLKTAERKKRAKKIALQKQKAETAQQSLKIVQTAQPQVTVELCPKTKTTDVVSSTVETSSPKVEVVVQPVIEIKSASEDIAKSDNSNASKEQPSIEGDSEKRKSGITSELTTLQRTLKEIKMQRNGSLQIKSKYQVLTPIIRKITVTSNERKKQEQRIKNLLQELNEARSNLTKSHETFSALVRELVNKKEKIDKSCQDTKTSNKKVQNGNLVKKQIRKNSVENSSKKTGKDESDKIDAKSIPITSTPIKSQPNGCLMEEATISTIITTSTNNDCEDMDVCNSDEMDMCQIDIVDPNDIDQIFKRKSVIKSTIPEYVSPLNYNACERYSHVDPNGIMCPYEVNGSCRDIDCTFKHYLKNHERL